MEDDKLQVYHGTEASASMNQHDNSSETESMNETYDDKEASKTKMKARANENVDYSESN